MASKLSFLGGKNMKNKFLKSIAGFMALVLCISVIPVFRVDAAAADFSYTYDATGTYIYNWGARGELATALSPKAEAFYQKQNAYDVLSTYAGGTGTSDAPTSDLYAALQKMMKDAHSHETNYGETRYLYKYTDCQKGGGKISSFYSGLEIGPEWGSTPTWNREHTWPNSKGLGGNDENDIMMLRPTASSENSSRGNKAYGKSSGYYNPNEASNNTYDLRGDVARIFLYIYVRWGNVNGNGETDAAGNKYDTWGKYGVMESKDVLLEWMEDDPVDTWELGRNDSVECIIGTRNVFVDYPEFAFMLFGEEVPSDMATPSGEAANKCDHNNFDAGVVTAPTCTAKGYTTYTCQTKGCNYSYRAVFVDVIAHDYQSGFCSMCGAVDASAITYATEVVNGMAYKLGLFSTNKNDEYFFTGTMNGYYGMTDTEYEKGVDVYTQATAGGYHLYFVDENKTKQYINLVANNTYRNFTFAPTAQSVFVWDDEKDALYTTVNDEICYMGTYGNYVTMSVLRESQMRSTDYIARLYAIAKQKQGWQLEDGKWYFYDNGLRVVNKWMKDSKGWVKLGDDGAMLTNKWTTDSKGWCYVGADGYAVTNCWKKDSKGWIYLNSNGSMTKSKWIKDNGKWYYVDAAGYMVSNKWMKDSKGWVKLGSNGAMLTNKWTTDSKGWCYVGADGYAVTNCWKKDSKGWIYLDANGSMTKSKWIKGGTKWYYVDAAGYMVANKTVTIGGKKYTFNASGVCTNP